MLPRPLSEQNADAEKMLDTLMSRAAATINCCVPGVVTQFFPASQTASIQPTVRRRIRAEKGVQEMAYPLLTDVPVLMLGGGQHFFTMPVQPGDECIVLFADSCIDAWWQSGSIQNPIIARTHDLSDGFALVGFRSKPNTIENMNAVYPAVSDLVIGGKRFSEWMIGISGHFEGETLVIGPAETEETEE